MSGPLCVMLVSCAGADAQTANPSATPQATRSVRGSGVTGRLPKWTSDDTLGDSIVTESNGNIGIGTTTPGSKLTVAGRIEAFTPGFDPALLGQSQNGFGVRGSSDTNFGVFGSSTTGTGVHGFSNSGDGVFGFSHKGNGVFGITGDANTAGVFGFNSASGGNGILGQSFNGTGVRGISSTSFGVFGSSDSFTAVEARSNTGFGIFGSSNSNIGIHGQSNTGTGVLGLSNSNLGAGVSGFNSAGGIGVTGQTATGVGVFGASNTGVALLAQGGTSTAVLSIAGGGPAAEFIGDVAVSGTFTKSGGSFKIDHPLDPANQTLSHSFVESPDMMNIYNGNIITNELGEATVTLPDYFEALNGDYRYQLTVIGQFAQAIVAEEVKNNRFRITTSIPKVKVSWQVTGVRRDAWAKSHRIPVEEEKPQDERGFYLHPELFGQSEDRGIEWVRRPELMKRLKTINQRNVP
jgi:hypothetical protein